MKWSTMVVPTYPEGGSHALQVCQHHHQVVRVGDFVGLSETGRTWRSRLLRPIRLKPSRSNTAHSALYGTVKVAGGGPSVHACAVFFRAKSRDGGTNSIIKPFKRSPPGLWWEISVFAHPNIIKPHPMQSFGTRSETPAPSWMLRTEAIDLRIN